MLTGNEYFVVVKLTSGEQVLSALEDEDDSYVKLLHPMIIRTIPNLASGKEHITAAPLCSFTDDNSYVLDKRNVLFIKDLSETFIPHYMRIVEEHQETSFVSHEEEMSEEEIKRRVSALAKAFGDELDDSLDEKVDVKPTFVEGNDTKH